jgi:HAD superfamily hydrolase (TIGR01509 family)
MRENADIQPLKALIFDVDGTLAETEELHRIAFNRAFAEAGIGWNWTVDEYRQLLLVTGGKERIRAFMHQSGLSQVVDIPGLHARKTEIYRELVEGSLELRPGVRCLIDRARREGLRLAIATTTSRSNVDVLLETALGPGSDAWFDAICCGDEVSAKKPDPAIYLLALEQLGLPAGSCLAVEDSDAGLQAALSAGIPNVVVTPSIYTSHHSFEGATIVLRDLAAVAESARDGDLSGAGILPAAFGRLLADCRRILAA